MNVVKTGYLTPDYSTLCKRQKHIDIAISYQKSSDGLYLLVDSTGLKFLGEGEWKMKKHQPALNIENIQSKNRRYLSRRLVAIQCGEW